MNVVARGTNYFIFYWIFMALFVSIYIFLFYETVIKKNKRYTVLRMFYNAICNIFDEAQSNGRDFIYCFNQVNVNYEKLCQNKLNINYTSILDLLETIIYYNDSYYDDKFFRIFRKKKRKDVRAFISSMCDYIKKNDPFISVPKKESDIMRSIEISIRNNNVSLGINALFQLSQEIESKEKKLIKMEKDNQTANIVSIVGLVLTVFFGILSIIPSFK